MRDPELADAEWSVFVRLRLAEPISEDVAADVLRRLGRERHAALSVGRERATLNVDDGYGSRRSLTVHAYTLAPSAIVASDTVHAEVRGILWLLEVEIDNVVEIHVRPWDELEDDDDQDDE